MMDDTGKDDLIIPSRIRLAVIDHVIQELPNEGCGLLSGKGNRVRHHIRIRNTLQSPSRFFLDGKELLRAFEWIENHGQVLLAIYHSHPSGPVRPSMTDLQEDHYPDVVKIIVSEAASQWELKGFIINDGKYEEIPLVITPDVKSR